MYSFQFLCVWVCVVGVLNPCALTSAVSFLSYGIRIFLFRRFRKITISFQKIGGSDGAIKSAFERLAKTSGHNLKVTRKQSNHIHGEKY